MTYIFLLLSGLIIGGGLTGWWLSKRWREQVHKATDALQDIAAQHKHVAEESRELKQQVADLTYQLNEAKKTIKHLENKHSFDA